MLLTAESDIKEAVSCSSAEMNTGMCLGSVKCLCGRSLSWRPCAVPILETLRVPQHGMDEEDGGVY